MKSCAPISCSGSSTNATHLDYTYPTVQGVRVDELISLEDRTSLCDVFRKYFGFDFLSVRRLVEGHNAPLFDTVDYRAWLERTAVTNYRHFAFAVELKSVSMTTPSL